MTRAIGPTRDSGIRLVHGVPRSLTRYAPHMTESRHEHPDMVGADAPPQAPPGTLPMVVDLDGTLVHTDTLVESALSAFRADRYLPFRLLPWLLRGRAHLKARIAARAGLDVRALPYNAELIEYLEKERDSGRALHLATAAHRSIADSVAAHLGLFTQVFASDELVNLKSDEKARLLVEQFGVSGFVYAGDSRADIPVWRAAAAAVVVGAPPRVLRGAKAATRIEREFPRRQSRLSATLKAIRVHQWAKNLLVFVPAALSHQILQGDLLVRALVAFVAFSLVASGIYLVNDLADLEADRRHHRKRRRPFASGALPLTAGLAAPILVLVGTGLGAVLTPSLGLLLGTYAAITVLYSSRLKTQPLVDAFTLALLYTFRLLAGGLATDVRVSIWLLTFSGFFFLGLAFIKRAGELMRAPLTSSSRRGYEEPDIRVIETMGIASSFTASLVLALWVDSGAARSVYGSYGLLWGMVPLVLFWQCRLWLATSRGYMEDDPIIYAARDWVTWIVVGLMAVVFTLASSQALPLLVGD